MNTTLFILLIASLLANFYQFLNRKKTETPEAKEDLKISWLENKYLINGKEISLKKTDTDSLYVLIEKDTGHIISDRNTAKVLLDLLQSKKNIPEDFENHSHSIYILFEEDKEIIEGGETFFFCVFFKKNHSTWEGQYFSAKSLSSLKAA